MIRLKGKEKRNEDCSEKKQLMKYSKTEAMSSLQPFVAPKSHSTYSLTHSLLFLQKLIVYSFFLSSSHFTIILLTPPSNFFIFILYLRTYILCLYSPFYNKRKKEKKTTMTNKKSLCGTHGCVSKYVYMDEEMMKAWQEKIIE